MRSSSALALLVAIVLGGIAAFLAREFLQGIPEPTVSGPSRTIVVASQPLNFGASLTPDNLQEIPWPSDTTLEGAFATKTELLKEGRRLALVPMQRNEPILASKVTGPNQRATLSTMIDEGMRAVSVRVDDVRGVSGFVLPGDRVDVVLTRDGRSGSSETGGPMADVLLQNVKVLAIDQVAAERQEKPTVARSVTLELNVQQAQKVILAEGVGKLSLILRQAGEAVALDTRRVTLSDLGMSEAIDTKEVDRFAKLEAELVEMRKAAEASEAAAREEAMKRVAELEARLKQEHAQKAAIALPTPVAAKRDDRVIVNVIRGGAKRDEYSVQSESR